MERGTPEPAYVLRDNGVRCIRAPCPSIDVIPLSAGGARQVVSDVDFSALGLSDDEEGALGAALESSEGLRVEGRVEPGDEPGALVFRVTRVLNAASATGASRRNASGGRDASLAALRDKIAKAAEAAGGVVGVSAVHLETGRRVSLNGDLLFPMASAYKLAIALQLLHRVERGEIDLGDSVTLSPPEFRPGTGIVPALARGKPITLALERLLELMMEESDNSASDALLILAGGSAEVTRRLRELGIAAVHVNRPERQMVLDWMGLRSDPPENWWARPVFDSLLASVPPEERRVAEERYASDTLDSATPDAMADMLAALHRGDALDAENQRRLVAMMTRSRTGPKRLKGLLPAGTPVAHKTGSMGAATNDVGIIGLPRGKGHLAIAVFIKQSRRPVSARERAIAEIARLAYDFFTFSPSSPTPMLLPVPDRA